MRMNRKKHFELDAVNFKLLQEKRNQHWRNYSEYIVCVCVCVCAPVTGKAVVQTCPPLFCSRAKQSSFTFDQAVLIESQPHMEESFTIHLGQFSCYGYITMTKMGSGSLWC